MPMYEYQCRDCDKSFEKLIASAAGRDNAVKCPHCGSKKTGRQISTFAVASASGSGSDPAPAQGGMCGCGRVRGSCGGGGM